MRYREQRLPCDTEVAAIVGEEMRRVRSVNLSATGARMEGLGRLPSDSQVVLRHLDDRFAARIVWANDRQPGLRFVRPCPKPSWAACVARAGCAALPGPHPACKGSANSPEPAGSPSGP